MSVSVSVQVSCIMVPRHIWTRLLELVPEQDMSLNEKLKTLDTVACVLGKQNVTCRTLDMVFAPFWWNENIDDRCMAMWRGQHVFLLPDGPRLRKLLPMYRSEVRCTLHVLFLKHYDFIC